MRKALKVLAVLAVGAMVSGQALAVPGPRTSGTGSTACNDGSITWTPTRISPPNHKMATVTIKYSDIDNDGDTASIRVDAITHNQAAADGTEELNGSGQPTAQQGLDWSGVGNSASAKDPGTATTSVQVRAERSGTDPAGRTYDITVTCTDTGGNGSAASAEQGSSVETQTVTLQVVVPHDQARH